MKNFHKFNSESLSRVCVSKYSKHDKMLRSNVLFNSKRMMATVSNGAVTESSKTRKTWAEGSEEESYKAGKLYRNVLLDGVPKTGPPSLRSKFFRKRYNSPLGLNEAFDSAYEILKAKSQEKYKQLNEVELELAKNPESKELKESKIKLEIEAEINNPEVKFNFEYNEKYDNNTRFIDYSLPVYRALKKKHWESYNKMLLMQRLETLAVIPDTLPTLEPKVEVSLKFLNHTAVNRWIEPGSLLSSNVTAYPPSIKIQEFENVDVEKQLYTVLIVNPDVADVANNTYKTHLQWGLSNIKINYNDNFITPSKILNGSSINEIIDYYPPVPEKNLPKQRFAVWVFRQSGELGEKLQDREFSIREFVEKHSLEPVGAHVWRSAWDLNVRNVRELYGLPEGEVFHKVKGRHFM